MHKKHFFLSNNIAEARGFSPQKQGFDGHALPSKDRAAQASMVKEQYVAVVNQIVTHLEEREKQGRRIYTYYSQRERMLAVERKNKKYI